jgi:hypothetical protein
VEADVRQWCEFGDDGLWISAVWLDVLGRERVQAIVSEYGYGPMQPSSVYRVHREVG